MELEHDFDIQDMIFFPGKELSDTNIAGKRMVPRSIRLAVGVKGVYKFHPDNDELIHFWSFSEITDWNYSGYSFTLNLKSRVDYHLRTNDGPSISHWIEIFSKSPDQALVEYYEFKTLGDDNHYQPPMFYTLNTRKRHANNPSSAKSRLLSAYGVDQQKQNLSLRTNNTDPVINGNDLKRWSTGYSSAEKGKSMSPYRSASTDVLDKSDDINDARAKSMECLINGMSSPVNDPSDANRLNGESNSISDYEETPPVVPPRNASLNKSNQSNSFVQEPSPYTAPLPIEQTVVIRVSDIDKQPPSPDPPSIRQPDPHVYEEIEIGVPSKYNKLEILPKPDQSVCDNDYDHLFPGKNHQHKHGIRRKKSKEKVEKCEGKKKLNVISIRRNESLPLMAFHSPVVSKPLEPPKDDESGKSDSEMDEPISPLPTEYRNDEEPIVIRRKSKDAADPFVDLLSAPPNKSRLRWSQELNPIYDYVKGVKISPKLGYDSLATNTENTILEEDTSVTEDTTSVCSSERRSSSDSQFEGLVFIPQSAPNTLQRVKRVPHNYEEVVFEGDGIELDGRERSSSGSRPLSEHYNQHMQEVTLDGRGRHRGSSDDKPHTLRGSPLRRLKSSESPFAVSPQLNKRVLQRKSKTVRSSDDSRAPLGRQRAQKVADTMRDFSYITREYRLFYIKMPTGHLLSEVVNINKPVSVLLDKLAELLGSRTTDSYSLYVEGAILTTMKEASLEFGELQPAKAHVNTSSVSLTQLVDNNSLADQGDVPILLKSNLSFRVQGITTARILRLDDTDDVCITELHDTVGSIKHEFHKAWLSVVQGNQPSTLDNAVKMAAMQYQVYFLERTAENSVIGFCRPTEFLPAEFAGVRAIEGKIYKQQEKIKPKGQAHIQKSYVDYCRSLPTSNTLFFPVREARRRILHSAKLKPVLLGVNKHGIMRVCPKTKEVLESWEYQVLKNWAYSRRTFVVAFSNKNYPVESNQAKWISDLVDFHVQSIMHSSNTPPISS